MPELPEVETIVRQLRPSLTGQRIGRLEIHDPRLNVPRPQIVHGTQIHRVGRHGKYILLHLTPPGASPPVTTPSLLVLHLRMTGQLIWNAPQAAPPTRPKALRARLWIDGGGRLDFMDVRRFGTLSLHTAAAPPRLPGLDPTTPAFTATRLGQLLAGRRTPLKAWLLSQNFLAGLGNIYACEILFAARLHPARPAGSLAPAQIATLYKTTRAILRRAIAARGTSFSDYRDAQGRHGQFQHQLAVYGRAGNPCPACNRPLQRITQQGRSTVFCSHCQK